ncbi:MAG: hypothetical protein QOK31_557, partial [Solirubrobacteraceae bacterium]|nr:hypothetical protein [Solirubrobacteraceae bacterium]
MADGTQQVALPQGTIHYRESGSGPTLLFIHGLLVNGTLWRKVVPRLEDRFRCVVPDLPLGSHREPMAPDADLTPPGLAQLIADFTEALGLEDVTLVGNDTGGALCQLVATNHPDSLARLVLTPCDAYENFLPPAFRPLQVIGGLPGGVNALVQPMRFGAAQQLPFAFGMLTKRPIERAVRDGWVHPAIHSREIRRDVGQGAQGHRQALHARSRGAAARVRSADADRLGPGGPLLQTVVRGAPGRGDSRRAP